MVYKEEIMDLFAVPEEYYLAHCISADFGMGKGIVVEFNKKFGMKKQLQLSYPDYINEWSRRKMKSDCLLKGRVFNLITKERYFHKSTYESIRGVLELMKLYCLKYDVQKVAMPTIGCGLERLQWDKVSKIIQEVFEDTDVEILVCRQENTRGKRREMPILEQRMDGECR